jgi:hypothetical protein
MMDSKKQNAKCKMQNAKLKKSKKQKALAWGGGLS